MRKLAWLLFAVTSCVAAQVPTIPVRGIPSDLKLAHPLLPRAYPRPASVWKDSEKSVYAALLAKGQFDVLVVPVQTQDYSFDRPSRSLMGAQLALAIAATGKYRVPDPYLVARALGDGDRRINPEDVFRLAGKLGVKRIVWSYAGYLEHGQARNKVRFNVQHQDRLENGFFDTHLQPTTLQRFDVAFSETLTPAEAFRSVLPKVLESIGVQATPPAKPVSLAGDAPLPESLRDLLERAGDPARDAHYFQLLAALTPEYAERNRERYAEKSLLAVLDASPLSPGYRYLKARAYMYLGDRVAALNALGAPRTVEEQHLLALLNGDLPSVRRLVPQVKSPLNALIAKIDANTIGANYRAISEEKSREDARALKLKSEALAFFVERAFTDWSLWMQHDNVKLKQLLDKEMPVAGFSLAQIAGGTAAFADLAKLRAAANLSVLDHVRRLLSAHADQWCCTLSKRLGPIDYVDFYESLATDNLARRARFLVQIQGAPEAALEFVARIESVYKDHPQFTLARARAEAMLAARSSGAAREGYGRSAYLNALNAFYWEQAQTRTAAEAFHVGAGLGRHDFGRVDNVFAHDLPFRSFYATWESGGRRDYALRNARNALANSMFNVQPLRELQQLLVDFQGKHEEFDDLLATLKGRFVGHPEMPAILAGASLAKGDTRAAATLYRQAVKANPSAWESYEALGKLLFEEGETAEAAKVYMSYPGFTGGTSEHPVAVANHSYEAGSRFFWSGNFEQARPLYQIAAKLKTGADSSLASSTRLALLEGDLQEAAKHMFARATRYNSAFAYRDFLGLRHAMGNSEEAWDAFRVLARQVRGPQLWETALVGHRMAGLTAKEIAAWLAKDPSIDAAEGFGYGAMHLVRAGVVDRKPGPELAGLVEAADRPVYRLEQSGVVARPAGQSGMVLGPDAPNGGLLHLGAFERGPKQRVKSDRTFFVEAYAAIRDKQYALASALLVEATSLYDVRNVRLGYLLPYLAFAAAKDRNIEPVRALLARFDPEQRRFDYFMAEAVLSGLAGAADEARRALKLALHRRPFTELRPVYTEYQYAEICEWLYEATGDRGYADLALNWAKSNQAVQPWFAWAYALEAKLTSDPAAKKRAIVMTHYLDRNSERLASLPPDEVKAALEQSGAVNPFVAEPTKRERI